MRVRRLFLCLMVIGFCAQGRAETLRDPTGKEMRALFPWFDQLPLPSVRDCKFVRVWTGSRTTDARGYSEWSSVEGFLLREDDKTFRVVLRDWTVTEFEKEGTQPETEGFVGFRELSLRSEVEKALRDLGTAAEAKRWEDAYPSYHDRLSRTGQLFAIARELDRRGERKLADALLRKLPAWRKVMSNSRASTWSIEEDLQDDFARVLRWRTIRAFDDADVTRVELLARFQTIARLCPQADYELKAINHYIGILERMVREDAEHPALPREQVASLPPAERAKELVFQLRDEVLGKGDPGYWPYVDPAPRTAGNGAADQLKKLRFDAVPALIAALDSEAFTREVFVQNRYGGGIWVEEIKAIAVQILNDIAGFNHHWQVPDYGMMKADERQKALREQIDTWWNTVREQGEQAYLLERLRDSDRPEDFAKLLLDRTDAGAIAAVIEAGQEVNDAKKRSELTKTLWKRDDPRVRAFFVQELQHGPTLGNRVAAAYGLRGLGDPQPLGAMLAEWKRIKADPAWHQSKPETGSVPELPRHVTDFLGSCAAPEAVKGLGEDFEKLPLAWKPVLLELVSGVLYRDPSDPIEKPTPATLAAAEAVLFKALDNRSSLAEDDLNWRRAALVQPRICDLAASYLAHSWPAKYVFEKEESLTARDRQIAICRNVRRHELGETEEPVSAAPTEGKSSTPPNIVTEAGWTADSLPPSLRLKELAEAMRGNAFRPAGVAAMFQRFSRHPETSAREMAVQVFRYKDLPGVRMLFTLRAGEPKGSADGLEYSASFLQGYSHSGGNHSIRGDRASVANGWAEFERAFDVAQIHLPKEPFLISVALSRR